MGASASTSRYEEAPGKGSGAKEAKAALKKGARAASDESLSSANGGKGPQVSGSDRNASSGTNAGTRDLNAVIRDRVEAMAERNAKSRKAVHPKLSREALDKLKPKERILEELRIKPVVADVTTTFSITIRWDYLYVAGEKQAQTTVVEAFLVAHESEECHIWSSLDASPDVQHPIVLQGSKWTALPEEALDVDKRQVYLGGIVDPCPGFLFRVRARHAVGWGDWSPQSQILQPLDAARPPPLVTLFEDNAYSAQVDWGAHAGLPSFGQVLCHRVTARLVSDGAEREAAVHEAMREAGFLIARHDQEVFSGRNASTTIVGCAAERVGQRDQRPLVPGATYAFRVETTMGLSRGDKRYHSKFTSAEVAAKVPRGAPTPISSCTATEVSCAGAFLSWTPPVCDGGGQILRYKVFCETLQGRNVLENLGEEPRLCFEANATSFRFTTETHHLGARLGFTVQAVNALGESVVGRPTWVRIPTLEEEEAEATAAAAAQARAAALEAEEDHGLAVDVTSSSAEHHDIMASPDGMVELPEGWNEYWDPASEELFYYNVLTGQNQWEKPTGLSPNARRSLVERHMTETEEEREWRLFRKKRFRFLHRLHKVHKEAAAAAQENPLAAFRLSVRRQHLVSDSLARLERVGIQALTGKLQVVFEGESGIDSGGLSKDWFLAFSNAMLQPGYCLFARTERGEYELDPRGKLVPEASAYIGIFGAVLGKALFDQQMVNAPLCTALLRRVAGEKPGLEDLRENDPVLARSLEWMLDNDIEDVIEETFTVTSEAFGAYNEVELIPGGSTMAVTNENKAEYVAAIVNWHCGGAARGLLEAFLNGFWAIVPRETVLGFTPAEMRLLLNGKAEISVEEIRNGCVRYSGGYVADSAPVELFWSVFASLAQIDRARVLRFATGCDRVPLDGFSPLLPFTLTRSEFDKAALPTAHTCFHQLVLPPYETEQELREKLLFACDHAVGFELT